MPVLQVGSSGEVVRSLQTLLTNGAQGAWETTPLGIDGEFGPHTKASVEAFQSLGRHSGRRCGRRWDLVGFFTCRQRHPRDRGRSTVCHRLNHLTLKRSARWADHAPS